MSGGILTPKTRPPGSCPPAGASWPILDDFENQLKNFVKVFPKDYKKALQEKGEKLKVESKVKTKK